jgi:hypothetical protein
VRDALAAAGTARRVLFDDAQNQERRPVPARSLLTGNHTHAPTIMFAVRASSFMPGGGSKQP